MFDRTSRQSDKIVGVQIKHNQIRRLIIKLQNHSSVHIAGRECSATSRDETEQQYQVQHKEPQKHGPLQCNCNSLMSKS